MVGWAVGYRWWLRKIGELRQRDCNLYKSFPYNKENIFLNKNTEILEISFSTYYPLSSDLSRDSVFEKNAY